MLRQDNGVGVGFLHRFPEFLPEPVIVLGGMAQVGSHVQPPAVRAKRGGNPFSPDIEDILLQLPGTLVVEHRQGIMSPPAVVGGIVREAVFIMELKIIMIRALPGNISPFLISRRIFVNPFPVQPLVEGTAVIEHPVQNHPHPPLMGFLNDLDQHFVAGFQVFPVRHPADIALRMGVFIFPVLQQPALVLYDLPIVGIHMVVILNIVLVIGGGNKNRVKIQNFHAQVFQIVHLIQDALQIPAVKIPYVHGRGILIPVLYAAALGPDILILVGQHVVGRIPVIEAVHINLVHDRALCPVRRIESRYDHKIVVLIRPLHHSPEIVVTGNRPHLYFKIIGNFLIVQLQPDLVIVKLFIGRNLEHQLFLTFAHQKNPVDVASLGTELDLYPAVWRRLGRSHKVFGCIRIKRPFTEYGTHFIQVQLVFE